MAIELSTLTEAARRRTATRSTVTLEEARVAGRKTVFLCHSHGDQTYVQGFVQLLSEAGWDAYVDWMDDTMPPSPNKTTALRIKRRISQSDFFMFLATPNSVKSRWCPWEIGFADGVKPTEAIIIVQTKSGGTTYGNEYLELYRRIDFGEKRKMGAWDPGQRMGVEVASL